MITLFQVPRLELLLVTLKTNTRITIMRKNISITLTLLALIGVAPLLGACNTTAGVGKDISAGGHAITHDANALAP